jgi:hypothetical protein
VIEVVALVLSWAGAASAWALTIWILRSRRRPPWFQTVLKKRLLVHTVAGKSFDGLLAEVVPDGIVLQQAKMLNGADGVPCVGGAFIPREQVLFTQLVD